MVSSLVLTQKKLWSVNFCATNNKCFNYQHNCFLNWILHPSIQFMHYFIFLTCWNPWEINIHLLERGDLIPHSQLSFFNYASNPLQCWYIYCKLPFHDIDGVLVKFGGQYYSYVWWWIPLPGLLWQLCLSL